MTELTLQKTHNLLEKLNEYVMTEVPTRHEMNGLLAKLTEYVMTEVPTRQEMNELLAKLTGYVMTEVPTRHEMNALFERLTGYVMTEVPTRHEMNERFLFIQQQLEQKTDKKDFEELKNSIQDIHLILDNMTSNINDMRIEQHAFNAAFTRLEDKVDTLEKKIDA